MPGAAQRATASDGPLVGGRAQAAAWAAFAFVDVMSLATVYESPGVALRVALLLAPPIVLLALALRGLFARLGLAGRVTLPVLAWIVAPSLGAAGAVVAAGFLVRALLGLDPETWARAAGVVMSLVYYFMIFTIWSLACFWSTAEAARRAERQRALAAEAQALRTEVERLRLQLNPHFVLNALNGIGEEIPEDPDAAIAMLRDLSVFLRQTLAGVDRVIVPVGAEAEALASYLRVQRARFGARLTTRLDVAGAAAGRRIPSFLLQPIVENAIEHGRRAPMLEIAIAIAVRDGSLEAVVTNTGQLEPPQAPPGRGGIGLDNLRRRLALHYPGRHDFRLTQRDGQVEARLLLQGEPRSL